MNLKGIIAISGMPGLFKLSGQMKNGIIVESLLDGKRIPAYASHKVSALEDISIYGESEDIPLGEVFGMIYKLEEGKESVSHKEDIQKLKDKLEEAFPDYDKDRVYSSDIKKLFQWYNLLVSKDVLVPVEEDETVTSEEEKGE